MIVSDLEAWKRQQAAFSPVLAKAVEYLAKQDFSKMEAGRYELDGDRMYAMVQEVTTEPKANRKPEAHDRYIDIQFLLEGEGEIIGVSRRNPDAIPSEDYLGSRDVAFYSDVTDESEVLLRPGMFAIFFPDDVHRPLCQVGETGSTIRKVVIKIDTSLL